MLISTSDITICYHELETVAVVNPIIKKNEKIFMMMRRAPVGVG